MFNKAQPNVIQCDEGFAIKVLGRTGILYTEEGRKLNIDSEVLMGPSGIVIYANSIKVWETPNGIQKIDSNERSRIINNIRRAFRFEGFEIAVMGTEPYKD